MSSGKLERAHLTVREPSSTGAKGGGRKIQFSFNPKEISFERSTEWSDAKSKKGALPEYVGTKTAAMTIEMFFDASEGGDVMKDVDDLLACTEPHDKTTKDKPSPPFVSFGWGKKTYLQDAVVKKVAVKYTRFRGDGTPIRAVATVTLEELRPVAKKQNPTSGAYDVDVERILLPGDTLQQIAYEELGSAELWRIVAEANGIDDPFRLADGRTIIIPSLGSMAER